MYVPFVVQRGLIRLSPPVPSRTHMNLTKNSREKLLRQLSRDLEIVSCWFFLAVHSSVKPLQAYKPRDVGLERSKLVRGPQTSSPCGQRRGPKKQAPAASAAAASRTAGLEC